MEIGLKELSEIKNVSQIEFFLEDFVKSENRKNEYSYSTYKALRMLREKKDHLSIPLLYGVIAEVAIIGINEANKTINSDLHLSVTKNNELLEVRVSLENAINWVIYRIKLETLLHSLKQKTES